MANYPIKLLKDETNAAFVPLVSTDCVRDKDNQTLQQILDKKLSPTNLLPGEHVSITTEGNNCYISVDLPAGLTLIDNLNTTTANQGSLDAHQGKVLKDMIPEIIDDITDTSPTKGLSANQGYLLNNKFNNYYPLSGGNLKGDMTIAKDAGIPYLTLKDTVNSYNITPTTTAYPAVVWTDKNNTAMGRLELIEEKNGSRCMSLYAIKPNDTTGGAFFKVGWNTAGDAFSSVDGNLTVNKGLTVTNNVSIGGSITVGSGFGKRYSFTKTLRLGTDWIDTGIGKNDLPQGAYVVYMTGIYQTDMSWQDGNIYTGIMTMFTGQTNASDRFEIPLHRGGHAFNGITISLATLSHARSTNIDTTLQIKASVAFTRDTAVKFTFVKII